MYLRLYGPEHEDTIAARGFAELENAELSALQRALMPFMFKTVA